MSKLINYTIPIINNSQLPTYPIPSLEDTLNRFLEWVEPLVSAVELDEAKIAVDEFITTKDFRKLDKKIQELGSTENDSWIYNYWVKMHLLIREPLSPHTNVPIIYHNDKLATLSVTERMAVLIHSTATIYNEFTNKGTGEYWMNNKRYSSDQFHGLLAAINDIKVGIDQYYINSSKSEHIVFSYRNHFYHMRVIENGQVVSYGQILQSIDEILSCTPEPLIPNVNYVTIGVDRDQAANVLSTILLNEENQQSYQKIKDAIMVMNYDDAVSDTALEQLHQACYNREHVNRWHGKGLQFSCSKNGQFSFVIDHAFVDGGTEIYFIELLKQTIDEATISFGHSNQAPRIERLLFDISNEEKQSLLHFKEEFDQCMDSFEARYVDFNQLSRSILKEKGILSGDGFFHLALQVAQYVTYQQIHNTYISVDVRKYFRGRTESNRPVSKESVHFAHEFVKKVKSKKELQDLMKKALDEHHRRVKLCQSGEGVNRYLYVLESVYKDFGESMGIAEQPSLFDTTAFKEIANNRLSTTSFGHPDIKYIYFPPVVSNGFGIYYMVAEQSFMIMTAFTDEIETMDQLITNLQNVITELLALQE
ncbi:hypothetical protein CSV79_11450 [Sporosarcina sp. P13]|uniref:choline/carnitine O-acyltransferase n=1 Tax=Sporosarcina sp. P13 TaxID=2048263 RepID=UPI000C163CF2|nr:choline/carnitine O-acyltransferase [Sporosarcina sp. P13]PIC63487.1 hypothetical protein CSV79_11450 [Sporosarcina sp. P13]